MAVRRMTTPAPRKRRTAAQTRTHLLDVATELFYTNGVRATGVDTVAAVAGVAPTALYRSFGSKDGLVVAYVEQAHAEAQALVDRAVSRHERAREQIIAVFVAQHQETKRPGFHGCACQLALGEFPDPTEAPRQRIELSKSWARDRFRDLARQHVNDVGRGDAELLGDQLALIFEGVHASAAALGAHGPATTGTALAKMLLA